MQAGNLAVPRLLERVRTFLLALGLMSAGLANAQALDLIKDAEATLPARTAVHTRGITRGPGIKLITPSEVRASLFDLQIRFEPRGGATVDPASVKVTYLKSPEVDLTERIRPGLSAQGISLAKVRVPQGEHPIEIRLKDSEGRDAATTLHLTAR